jgi:hypothetical protein
MKKQQFDMGQREIEEEKKKLNAIIAEKEAWHKWDNSTPPRVMEKAVKEHERMGEEFERDSKREIQQQQRPPRLLAHQTAPVYCKSRYSQSMPRISTAVCMPLPTMGDFTESM